MPAIGRPDERPRTARARRDERQRSQRRGSRPRGVRQHRRDEGHRERQRGQQESQVRPAVEHDIRQVTRDHRDVSASQRQRRPSGSGAVSASAGPGDRTDERKGSEEQHRRVRVERPSRVARQVRRDVRGREEVGESAVAGSRRRAVEHVLNDGNGQRAGERAQTETQRIAGPGQRAAGLGSRSTPRTAGRLRAARDSAASARPPPWRARRPREPAASLSRPARRRAPTRRRPARRSWAARPGREISGWSRPGAPRARRPAPGDLAAEQKCEPHGQCAEDRNDQVDALAAEHEPERHHATARGPPGRSARWHRVRSSKARSRSAPAAARDPATARRRRSRSLRRRHRAGRPALGLFDVAIGIRAARDASPPHEADHQGSDRGRRADRRVQGVPSGQSDT